MIFRINEKAIHSFTVSKSGEVIRHEPVRTAEIVKSNATAKKIAAAALDVSVDTLVVTEIIPAAAYYEIDEVDFYAHAHRTEAPRKSRKETEEVVEG